MAKKTTKKTVRKAPAKKKVTRKRAPAKKVKSEGALSISNPLTKIFPTKEKCNAFALGYTIATVMAVITLVVSILGRMGTAVGANEVIGKLHIYYSTSFMGILSAVAESALVGLLIGLLAGWVYNKFDH